MSEWQTIDTAPKNGTIVLICVDGAIHMAYWMDREEREYGVTTRLSQRWVLLGSQLLLLQSRRIDPTHWMPMPEPPTP